MMGAMKARTVVENQCRPSTMRMFFFVRVHVWRRKAILDGCLPRGEAILMLSSLLVKVQYTKKVRNANLQMVARMLPVPFNRSQSSSAVMMCVLDYDTGLDTRNGIEQFEEEHKKRKRCARRDK